MRKYIDIINEAFVDVPLTPQLKSWFGDSKVVDDNARPMLVFHGTSANIESFQHSNNGAGSRESKLGYWFTENAEAAGNFAAFARSGGSGSNIVPVYLSIQKPWYPETYRDIKDLVDRHTVFSSNTIIADRNIRMVQDKIDYNGAISELRSKGYDGVILLNTKTDAPSSSETINQYIVLSPNQIKSAFNNGNFDPTSEKISEDV